MRRPVKTRSRILHAARIVFQEKGYDAPLNEILAHASVSNGSFFHLFKTKAELVDELIAEILGGRHKRVRAAFETHTKNGQAALRAVIEAHLRWAEDEPGLASLLVRLPSSPILQRPATDAITHQEVEVVERWAVPLMKGRAVRELPAAVLHALIVGPADQLIRNWLAGAFEESPVTMAAILTAAVWSGISNTPRRSPPSRQRSTAQDQTLSLFG